MPTSIANNGNLITRRAFTDDMGCHPDRGKSLVRCTNNARSPCYRSTEDLPPASSRIPSPLHNVSQMIADLYEEALHHPRPVSPEQGMADYPAQFLAQLRGVTTRLTDATGKL